MFISFSLLANAQEICNNALDDDGDGLIDLNDPQCSCTGFTNSELVSIAPNPSFEDLACCPNWLGQVNCADPWQQISLYSSADYFNTCNFLPASITAMGLTPFPDGQGCMGMLIMQDYSEYLCTCLSSPMIAGTPYTVQMDIATPEVTNSLGVCPETTDYSPFELTIFGAPSCGNFPIQMYSGCPPAPFVAVGTLLYDPLASWETYTFTFTPSFNVAEIAIGAPCVLPPEYPLHSDPCYPYVMVDKIMINTAASFQPFSVQLSGSLCDGDAQLSVSPELPGGTWQWYEDGIALTGQTAAVLDISAPGLGGGNYTVTFNAPEGCASASITVADAVPFSISVNSGTICEDSVIVLSVTGTANSFTWLPAAGLSATSGPSVQASPDQTTTYTVTALGTGCSAQATSTVTVVPAIAIEVTTATTCPGGSVVLTASGASAYEWSPAAGLSNTFGSSVTAAVHTTTTFTVSGTTQYCSATGYGTVTIEQTLEATILASPNPVTTGDPAVAFSGQPSDGQLTWNFGDNTTATGPEVTHLFPGVEESYEIWMTVRTDEGCVDSASVTILVKEELIVYVPNAFTPDGDEHNAIFLPVFSSGFDASEYEFAVFNRWGEAVFRSNAISEGWDGTFGGSMVPDGEYTWRILIKSKMNAKRTELSGHVNVLR